MEAGVGLLGTTRVRAMYLLGFAAGPVLSPLPQLRSEDVDQVKVILERWKPFLSKT